MRRNGLFRNPRVSTLHLRVGAVTPSAAPSQLRVIQHRHYLMQWVTNKLSMGFKVKTVSSRENFKPKGILVYKAPFARVFRMAFVGGNAFAFIFSAVGIYDYLNPIPNFPQNFLVITTVTRMWLENNWWVHVESHSRSGQLRHVRIPIGFIRVPGPEAQFSMVRGLRKKILGIKIYNEWGYFYLRKHGRFMDKDALRTIFGNNAAEFLSDAGLLKPVCLPPQVMDPELFPPTSTKFMRELERSHTLKDPLPTEDAWINRLKFWKKLRRMLDSRQALSRRRERMKRDEKVQKLITEGHKSGAIGLITAENLKQQQKQPSKDEEEESDPESSLEDGSEAGQRGTHGCLDVSKMADLMPLDSNTEVKEVLKPVKRDLTSFVLEEPDDVLPQTVSEELGERLVLVGDEMVHVDDLTVDDLMKIRSYPIVPPVYDYCAKSTEFNKRLVQDMKVLVFSLQRLAKKKSWLTQRSIVNEELDDLTKHKPIGKLPMFLEDELSKQFVDAQLFTAREVSMMVEYDQIQFQPVLNTTLPLPSAKLGTVQRCPVRSPVQVPALWKETPSEQTCGHGTVGGVHWRYIDKQIIRREYAIANGYCRRLAIEEVFGSAVRKRIEYPFTRSWVSKANEPAWIARRFWLRFNEKLFLSDDHFTDEQRAEYHRRFAELRSIALKWLDEERAAERGFAVSADAKQVKDLDSIEELMAQIKSKELQTPDWTVFGKKGEFVRIGRKLRKDTRKFYKRGRLSTFRPTRLGRRRWCNNWKERYVFDRVRKRTKYHAGPQKLRLQPRKYFN